MYFTQIILVLVTSHLTQGSNYQGNDDLTNENEPANLDYFDAEDYLERYGYLPKSSGDETIQHSEETRSHAIRLFQRFADLPISGILDRATVDKMQMKRCGVPDITTGFDPTKPQKYNLNEKWRNKRVTWKIQSYAPKLSKKKQNRAFYNAVNRWSENSGLNLQQTAVDQQADINILFASGNHGDGSSFDGEGGILAHAFAPEDGGTHFDADEKWRFHSNKGTELEITATHEIGHALGLSHSMTRGSIMVPFYQRYTPNFKLHTDDIAGIKALYGPPKRSNEVPGLTTTTTTTKSTTTAPVVLIDPSVCSSKFHAITRGPEGYIQLFIGLYMYKLKDSCTPNESCVLSGYPRLVRSVYKRAPRYIGAAAYIPDSRKRTYFFKGRKIWRYTGYTLDPGYPRRLNKTVMPFKPTAAYVHKNQFADYQLYLFAGKYFWEMNLYTDLITNGVMKVRKYWTRMPTNPDAIVQTRNGYIYVFKGKYYRKYDHLRGLMDKKKLKAPAWLGGICRYAPR